MIAVYLHLVGFPSHVCLLESTSSCLTISHFQMGQWVFSWLAQFNEKNPLAVHVDSFELITMAYKYLYVYSSHIEPRNFSPAR